MTTDSMLVCCQVTGEEDTELHWFQYESTVAPIVGDRIKYWVDDIERFASWMDADAMPKLRALDRIWFIVEGRHFEIRHMLPGNNLVHYCVLQGRLDLSEQRANA